MIMLSVVICLFVCFFFFFKQKTAYEMRISDWSSDVCSSDLVARTDDCRHGPWSLQRDHRPARCRHKLYADDLAQLLRPGIPCPARGSRAGDPGSLQPGRSEEHTSELQSLMRISYAVFCLKHTTQTQRKH